MRDWFVFDLQLFAAEGGAGGGDSDAGGKGGDGSHTDPNAGGGGGGDKITFTPEQQAHIDALVAQRLARANKTAGKAALEARAKELGFESVEAMDEALEAHKKAQDAQKTEAQKLQEQLAAEKAARESAEQRAKASLIKAAFTAAAVGADLVDVDDAFKLADLSDVTVDDEGNVTGVKEAVEALAKDKPYLLKSSGGYGGGGGNPPRGGQQPDDDAERGRQMAMRRSQQAQAQAAGYDPWAGQAGAGGGTDVSGIAQAVAAAVAAALQGQGNK